jgi:magnesium transporter
MITAFVNTQGFHSVEVTADNKNILKDAIWIDLLSPTKAEEKIVEKVLGLDVPTRDEMREIEVSSRLYEDDGVLYMTATMLAQADSDAPKYDAVTFVLTPKQLITVRYIEPQTFELFIGKLSKHHPTSAGHLLLDLLDVAIDRLADILEYIGHSLDEYSKNIFDPQAHFQNRDYQVMMRRIGITGDLITKGRESLLSFNRVISFFGPLDACKKIPGSHSRIITFGKDITSLSDHATFLSSKINFLLDATLGLINIEQNNIIKIFSVAAVIFLPPTLIASIYGMNFHDMPELNWRFGYIMAVCLMLLSAWLPYRYFKQRKWL